jgi:small nuclear ribonucleoprotein (snRNP)-like protein
MSIEARATQLFNRELSSTLTQFVRVNLDYNNRFYRGKLTGADLETLSLVLENAVDEKNNKYDKLFIRGQVWETIQVEGEPFPMDKLVERIKKVLPGEEITIGDDNKVYLLGGKLIITEKGVEGRGPTKDRVQKVFESFIAEMKK